LRKSFFAAGTAALALSVVGIASAQDQPTTTVSVTLSPNKAGTSKKPKATKLVLKITNNAQKQTASQLKIVAPKGIKLTTADFKKCDVKKLANEGPTACDKASQVGPTTQASAQAGVNGNAPTPVKFDVTPFATGSKTIAFFLRLSGGSITGVATGKISGQTLTVSIPENPAQQLPAGVYNGLVDITTNLWVKSGKSLVKITSCPSSKKLTFKNTITFVNNPGPPAVPKHTATADAKCS
jgi:hypothetical protein